ncbi:MAG: porin [Alphaproteobacteria bacterium]
MKKILLGTTTLVGVALLAGAASAETPKVTLGGVADFQAGFVSEDNDANERSGAFKSDTELMFDIAGVADNGLKYGGHVTLEADANDDVDSQGTNAARTYLYMEGAWGRAQMGSDLGVTNTMKIDASRIARATGGIDGDFTYFGVNTNTPGNNIVIGTPDLLIDYGAGQLGDESSENINKLSYYTPRFSGFQAGVSYLFDSTGADRGQTISRADNTTGEAENVFLWAANWEGKFDQVGIRVGGTGEWGSSEDAANEDLRTWQAGAELAFMGFKLAGSYGSWGDSLTVKTANTDDRHFWTLGGAYEYGPYGMSVTYLDSTLEEAANVDNEFNNIAVGVDYKLAPGFTPYAEVSFFEIDGGQGTGLAEDNDGTVFIVGSTLAF